MRAVRSRKGWKGYALTDRLSAKKILWNVLRKKKCKSSVGSAVKRNLNDLRSVFGV